MIGELARKRGAESPNRLVASAKSWLSYAAVNRTAPILPWQAPEEVPKLSPVEASSQFLQYLRTVWDSSEAGEKRQVAFAEQDVLLTVPASFDEEARELTRRAAEQAGYHHVTLLEEPQAAFYAWLESQGDGWRRRIKVGDLVIVCDVGGGTTDFSLIVVSEENGELTLKRVAVGDHILLGGDNMDLALARVLQQRLEASGNRVDTWQLHGLWHQCRIAKEKLFESPKTQNRPITLLGKGTKLIGGTIKTELTREDLDGDPGAGRTGGCAHGAGECRTRVGEVLRRTATKVWHPASALRAGRGAERGVARRVGTAVGGDRIAERADRGIRPADRANRPGSVPRGAPAQAGERRGNTDRVDLSF